MIFALALLTSAAAVAVSVPMLVFVVECLAALTPPPRRAVEANPQARPSLGVIVPAHNEELTLAESLAALIPQLWPGDRVVVVADNCTDRTAAIARAAGAECVERSSTTEVGKGHALAAGLDHLRDAPPAVVVIIDADCRVLPRALGRLAAAAAANNAPVQCVYLLEPDRDGSPLSRMSNFAFLVKNLVRQRGLMVLGQPALLQGTGMAFPWMVIDAAQLATGHITEDLVIGLEMLERGHSPRFCDTARVVSDQAAPDAEVAQRTRWEHGYLSTMISRGPRLLIKGLTGRPELLGMAADLTVPPLSLLMMLYAGVTALAGAATLVTTLLNHPLALAMQIVLAWLGLLGVAFAVVITAVCRVFARSVMPASTLLQAPLYALSKLPIYFGFLAGRETRWVRTERHAAEKPGAGSVA
ncbi:glycosyltransferase family 2 protein [Phycisphaera mikurensis]|uniref:Putative glycosyltransferase n=1 Tax=Phycisphaera mikurensis (strain NBRC 102666 / KCTC 22515 / FYK2301M01) TaxID=1142394 RepID=I0IBC9_PHYMF|nr:glycosyltransferase family 2 protein [Phycisphaera mikurensis]MBB6443061.1 cellulose synthase/poly-beta-1,6-N-acetylglucosamine synthase-like glycosyltransferase [Phycisphaera mikurensis]BAM02567.1 putative glycosyltransferase [Phycisphaera mikurensis NBRC 102666]